MGVFLEKLTFNSRVGTSCKHVVYGECPPSTNSVLSKLVQLAGKGGSPCILCLWESESLSQGLGLSKAI